MNWITRAERRFGHLAIPNLIRVITGFSALVFILYKLVNPHLIEVLALDPQAVMRGQVWRLVTYIFIPSIGSPIIDWIWAAFYIGYMWWIGDGLENAMGSFRVNVFYLLGMIGVTIAAFYTRSGFAAAMLNSSLLFAFARFYPEEMIYLMGLVPVKVKWLAWISGIFLVLGFLANGWSYRISLLVAFANYFIFFGREIFQDAVHRREVHGRRMRFEAARRPDEEAMHRCATCGRTEIQAPDLEFRVARDGQEYCVEHLPKAPTPPAPPAAQ
ncbi:hypothetical protein EV701_10324 [Chthoniobacter flavus]|nr:hypothetical protein [Chthoniobacter flavus]TCO93938.1 hypothetical protein EV701_10324 [Chthoniobacter flavus]